LSNTRVTKLLNTVVFKRPSRTKPYVTIVINEASIMLTGEIITRHTTRTCYAMTCVYHLSVVVSQVNELLRLK